MTDIRLRTLSRGACRRASPALRCKPTLISRTSHRSAQMMRRYLSQLLAVLLCSASGVAAQGGQGQQVQLPEGNGRDLVQATCSRCHSLANIRNAGYSAQGWRSLFSSMVKLPDAEAARIAEYLAAHFPENPA